MMSNQIATGSGITEFRSCLICECKASLKEDEICNECHDVIKQIEGEDGCPARYTQLINEFKSRLAIKDSETTLNNRSHLFQLLNVCREARMKTVDTLNDAATKIVGLSSTKSSLNVPLMMVLQLIILSSEDIYKNFYKDEPRIFIIAKKYNLIALEVSLFFAFCFIFQKSSVSHWYLVLMESAVQNLVITKFALILLALPTHADVTGLRENLETIMVFIENPVGIVVYLSVIVFLFPKNRENHDFGCMLDELSSALQEDFAVCAKLRIMFMRRRTDFQNDEFEEKWEVPKECRDKVGGGFGAKFGNGFEELKALLALSGNAPCTGKCICLPSLRILLPLQYIPWSIKGFILDEAARGISLKEVAKQLTEKAKHLKHYLMSSWRLDGYVMQYKWECGKDRERGRMEFVYLDTEFQFPSKKGMPLQKNLDDKQRFVADNCSSVDDYH
ncbi:uncharacterized protein LOC135685072 isoform X2 [Rhopilema esculentum]